jgi:alkylation response protein AidB-like acyl-CoA dehydrogenase
MRVTLSDEERAIAEVASRLFADRVPLSTDSTPASRRALPAAELMAEMGALGFFSEGDESDETALAPAVTVEAAGYELVCGPLIDQFLAVRMLSGADSVLAALTTGEMRASVAFDVAARGLALDEGSATVSGVAQGLYLLDDVDLWLLRLPFPAGSGGVAVVAVSPADPGVEIQRPQGAADPLGRMTVSLDWVNVAAIVEVTPEQVNGHLDYACGLVAAHSVGAIRRLLGDAVRYVTQRRQFGHPVGSFQAVKHLAANIYVDLLHARSLTYGALGPDGGSAELRSARIGADRAYRRAAQTAMQMYGGIGFTAESSVHLFVRDAQRLRSWPVPVLTQIDQLRTTLGLDGPAAVPAEDALRA